MKQNTAWTIDVNEPTTTTTITSNDYETWFDAAKSGEVKKMKFLINKGIDVNCCSKKGWHGTALIIATGYNRIEVVKLLLSQSLLTTNKVLNLLLIRKNSVGMSDDDLKQQVSSSIDIDAKDKEWKKTALHYAIEKGYSDIVKLLLEYGANLNISSINFPHHTSLQIGFYGNEEKKEVIKLLLEYGYYEIQDVNWALLEAITLKYTIDTIKLLLEHGADPNFQDEFGRIVLVEACRIIREDHEAIIKLLIDYGADPNIRGKNGITALSIAIKNREEKVKQLLLKHGATFEQNDNLKLCVIS